MLSPLTDCQIDSVNIDDLDVDGNSKENNEKDISLQSGTDGRKMEGEGTSKHCINPDFPEEDQEQEILEKVEENIDDLSPSLSELSGLCPGWNSAFYGSECFSLEVHNYIRKLGKRKADSTQSIDAKKVVGILICQDGKNACVIFM